MYIVKMGIALLLIIASVYLLIKDIKRKNMNNQKNHLN